jgi:hypothetical protein
VLKNSAACLPPKSGTGQGEDCSDFKLRGINYLRGYSRFLPSSLPTGMFFALAYDKPM